MTTTYYLLLKKKVLGNFDEIDLEILEKQQRLMVENSRSESCDTAEMLSNGAKNSLSENQMNGECIESREIDPTIGQSLDEIQENLIKTEEVNCNIEQRNKGTGKKRAATVRKSDGNAEKYIKNGDYAEVEKSIEGHIQKAFNKENESNQKETGINSDTGNQEFSSNNKDSNYYVKSSAKKDKKNSSPNNGRHHETENNTNHNPADSSNFHIHQNINQQYHNNNFIIANPNYKFTNPVIIHHQHNLTDEVKNMGKNEEILSNRTKDEIEINGGDENITKSENKNFDFSGKNGIEDLTLKEKEAELRLEKSYNTQGKSQNQSKSHSNNTNQQVQAKALSNAQSLAHVQQINVNHPEKSKKSRFIKKSTSSNKDKNL